jgi:hypothetical protein
VKARSGRGRIGNRSVIGARATTPGVKEPSETLICALLLIILKRSIIGAKENRRMPVAAT